MFVGPDSMVPVEVVLGQTDELESRSLHCECEDIVGRMRMKRKTESGSEKRSNIHGHSFADC